MAELGRSTRSQRPEFRNLGVAQLASYRYPPGAVVSLLHRVSGVLMFVVGIPFVLYLFQNSITSELSFERYRGVVASWPGKLVLLALIWAFVHHLLAGIRFLMLDVHLMGEREQNALTARIVLGLSVVITLVCALLLFGLI
jgi:succinate dehydrogenase / fumarate reductase cytochrome b subunit